MRAERGISIESIHTDIVRSDVSGKQTFKVEAHLLMPANLSVEALQKAFGTLASEMMLDIALEVRPVVAFRANNAIDQPDTMKANAGAMNRKYLMQSGACTL